MNTQPTAFTTSPVSPFESHVVSGFRGLNAEALPRLNESLGTAISGALFERLLRQYNEFEKRDPTVGELRLLDAAVRLTADLPERVGAGEMITQCDEMASVWADAMRRRAMLNGGGSSPMTLPELLGLSDRWMRRTGSRTASPDRRLFTGEGCMEAAAAARCVPDARAVTEDGDDCLLSSVSALPPSAPSAGDLMILVRDAGAAALHELIHTVSPRRLVAAVTALDGRPLPLAAASGLPGLTINADRLYAGIGDDMILRLCRGEDILPVPPRVSVLLRVRAADLKPFLEKAEKLGLSTAAFGKVENTGRLTVTAGGFRIASVSLTFLSGLTAPRLCSIRLPEPVPCPDCVRRPALFGLPTPFAPAGDPALCVPTAVPGTVYTAGGTAVFAVSVPLPDDGTAYSRAVRAALTAVSDARAGGLTDDKMQMTVLMRGHGTTPAQEKQLPAADSVLWAAACGLYRTSAELCLPVISSDIRMDADGTDSLTVLVWGHVDASRAAGDLPVPTAVLPLLRKDQTDNLKYLAASLAKRGVRCVIRPVAVQMVTPPEPDEAASAPKPAPAPVPTVTAAAAQALSDACRDADLLVLAMSEADGGILLRDPAFADSLTRGTRVLAVGGVCRTLAAQGILPAALTDTPGTCPAAGRTLPMDVTDREGQVRRVVCRPTADLPVYPTGLSHLVTIHTPDGGVPDGFTAPDRDLIGFTGGLPDGFPLP